VYPAGFLYIYSGLKATTGGAVLPAQARGLLLVYRWVGVRVSPPMNALPQPGSNHPASYPIFQMLFAGLYLATQTVVIALYINARCVPPWALALLCLSRRLHSIYMLRLFNDGWAMFIAYAATLALQHHHWRLAVLLYSAAVSVKMNVLLMAPGVLAVLVKVGLSALIGR
jgi:alpha-1,3-mannosyltransferase